jgi:RimJ/RimL family protein N-acetyltransferase
MSPAAALIHAPNASFTPAASARRRRPRADDRRVRLRPLGKGEAGPLQEIFAGLGARSRQQRFLSPKLRLTDADLRELTNVDGHDRVALVAETPGGRPIGVARFVRNPDGESADVAVTIIDDWQGNGVGTLLAASLAQRAQQVGIRRFTLMMAPDNKAARQLMHRFSSGARCLTVDRYAAEFTVPFPESTCGADAPSHDHPPKHTRHMKDERMIIRVLTPFTSGKAPNARRSPRPRAPRRRGTALPRCQHTCPGTRRELFQSEPLTAAQRALLCESFTNYGGTTHETHPGKHQQPVCAHPQEESA